MGTDLLEKESDACWRDAKCCCSATAYDISCGLQRELLRLRFGYRSVPRWPDSQYVAVLLVPYDLLSEAVQVLETHDTGVGHHNWVQETVMVSPGSTACDCTLGGGLSFHCGFLSLNANTAQHRSATVLTPHHREPATKSPCPHSTTHQPQTPTPSPPSTAPHPTTSHSRPHSKPPHRKMHLPLPRLLRHHLPLMLRQPPPNRPRRLRPQIQRCVLLLGVEEAQLLPLRRVDDRERAGDGFAQVVDLGELGGGAAGDFLGAELAELRSGKWEVFGSGEVGGMSGMGRGERVPLA